MLDKNSIEDKKVIRRIQSGEAEDCQILIEKYYQEDDASCGRHDQLCISGRRAYAPGTGFFQKGSRVSKTI